MKASYALLLCGSLAILTGACSVPEDLDDRIGYAFQDAFRPAALLASHARTRIRAELTDNEGERLAEFYTESLSAMKDEPPRLLSRSEILQSWARSEIGQVHPRLLAEIFEAAEADPHWLELDDELGRFHHVGVIIALSPDGLDALGTEIVRWHAEEALVQGFDRERDRARLERFVGEVEDLQSGADVDAQWREIAGPEHSSWISDVLESAKADPHWQNADPNEVDHAFAFRSATQRFLAGWPPER